MSKQDYTTSMTVDQSPEAVFAAVNNVRGWWAEVIEGSTDHLGAEFKLHFGDIHYSTHKITELVPNEKVVWHTVDSKINFVEDKKEWTGTDIVFEISKQDDKTVLRFTHVGLVPAIECYGDCSNAWGMYINNSLYRLITTGKGQPEQDDGDAGKDLFPIKLNATQE
jgi:hypothetical protein